MFSAICADACSKADIETRYVTVVIIIWLQFRLSALLSDLFSYGMISCYDVNVVTDGFTL